MVDGGVLEVKIDQEKLALAVFCLNRTGVT